MKSPIKNYFWFGLIIVNLLIFGLFSHYWSSGTDYSLYQKRDSALIGMSYMTMNNEFYRIVSEEIVNAVEAHGDRLIRRDPALDLERQCEQIEEMLNQNITALIVTPVDWDGIGGILQKAREKGVFILVVDSDIAEPNLANVTITSNNYQAGRLMGQYVQADLKEGRVLVMTHEKAKSAQDRVRGFQEVLENDPSFELVGQIECEGQTELAMPALNDYLEDNSDIDGVFCLNDQAALGAVAALEQHDLLNTVRVYGVDGSPVSKALIYEKMMRATVAQSPNQLGKITAQSLYNLIGEKSVAADIKVPVELITSENLSEFEIDRWQ